MLKSFDELLLDLEELSFEFEMFNSTFKVICEGFEYGVNEIPHEALVMPGMITNKISNELRDITIKMGEMRSLHNG